MAPTQAKAALTALAAVGAVGASAALWGIGVERYLFTVREHGVRVLPVGAAPLRVLHLSDAHMAPWQRRKQRWMAALADEWRPDLVVNTGDNLGHAEGLRGLRVALDPLRGIPGVFVHGSNDHAAPSPRNPLRYFTGPSKVKTTGEPLDTQALDGYLGDELGWLDLNNAVGSLEVADVRVDAFGVSDAHRGWDKLEVLPELLHDLQADVAPAAVTIGVSHAPYRRVLDSFVGLDADMIFAGHTHGGQVRVPGYGALVANCDIPLRQARGLSDWTHASQTVPLNVSAGLGHSIYAPVRFSCRPEASLITLLPRN
ncbi:metallophosphoesterase [Microbacterium sp.]|uniref:metallophosphoesterase n=1 Tax=Microbacterium sp. TaxID=51671 RepID=UPI002E34AD03|nr:metallophosphoesterase [Microbacterium sp.]HEX5729048.1 metallophosphoesterase [Microbacterium sp.]